MRYYATTDYDGCPYITAGKRYEIEEWQYGGVAFRFYDDSNEEVFALLIECPHIGFNNWKIGVIRDGE